MLMKSIVRPAHLAFGRQSTFGFTKAVKKVILTNDVPNLGFKGEIAFVKPGYAFNSLVPRNLALFWTDPAAKKFTFSKGELKRK